MSEENYTDEAPAPNYQEAQNPQPQYSQEQYQQAQYQQQPQYSQEQYQQSQSPQVQYQQTPYQETYANEIPAAVKIVSILYYLGAVIFLTLVVFSILSFIRNPAIKGNNFYSLLILALVFLGFSILYFSIGKGLWRGKSWARAMAIIIVVLTMVLSLFFLVLVPTFAKIFGHSIARIFDSYATMIISIAINGLIASYLLFSKRVKEAFGK